MRMTTSQCDVLVQHMTADFQQQHTWMMTTTTLRNPAGCKMLVAGFFGGNDLTGALHLL